MLLSPELRTPEPPIHLPEQFPGRETYPDGLGVRPTGAFLQAGAGRQAA